MAQRRQLNEYHLNTIEKIRAHLPAADLIVQRGVGCRNKAKISGNSLRAAYRPVSGSFDGPQQLGLHVDGQLADFIQKQGASVGHIQISRSVRMSAGECALAVAEKFPFK